MRFILLTLVSLVAWVANFFLAPIAVLFATPDEHLPLWLSWMDTPDNKLAAQVPDRPFPEHDTKLKRWVNYTAWLYRNSMYGLSETLLGFTVAENAIYSCEGDERVGNKPLVEGIVKRTLVSGGITYWQWYYVKAWSTTRCIRINMGWKLWNNPVAGDKISIVFSPSPFMGYTK